MDFNERVWHLTKQIPKGKVTTYKLIAEKLNSKAYRLVGNALKNNTTPIAIPCHRVVCSNGSIGGYKGRLNNKEKIKLLEQECIKIKNNKIVDFKEKLLRF